MTIRLVDIIKPFMGVLIGGFCACNSNKPITGTYVSSFKDSVKAEARLTLKDSSSFEFSIKSGSFRDSIYGKYKYARHYIELKQAKKEKADFVPIKLYVRDRKLFRLDLTGNIVNRKQAFIKTGTLRLQTIFPDWNLWKPHDPDGPSSMGFIYRSLLTVALPVWPAYLVVQHLLSVPYIVK